jgi:hypothetical protein
MITWQMWIWNHRFNLGGEGGVVLKRNPQSGSYDYGGVTLGGSFCLRTLSTQSTSVP